MITSICGAEGCEKSASSACGRCGVVRYCCKQHQTDHWKNGHKAQCSSSKPSKPSQSEDSAFNTKLSGSIPTSVLVEDVNDDDDDDDDDDDEREGKEEEDKQELLAQVKRRIEELETELVQSGKPGSGSSNTISRNEKMKDRAALLKEMQLTIRKDANEKARNRQLLQSAMFEGNRNGSSKALPGQYFFKESEAHDQTASAVRHHFGAGGGGSHYHMAASKQFNKGLRLDGVVSRHSKQAAVRNGKKSKAGKQKSASTLGMLA
jgi:hypothetical protein